MFKEIETTKYTTYTSKRPNNYKINNFALDNLFAQKNQTGNRVLPHRGEPEGALIYIYNNGL